MKDNNNLIVYCEFEDGNISDVSLELLTKGRSLATQLGVKLEAVVLGDKLEGVEKQIFPYGVDRVYKFEDKKLYPYTSLPHASALINLFKGNKTTSLSDGSIVDRSRSWSARVVMSA